MFLTPQELKSMKPCASGYKYFLKNFPDGAEVMEILHKLNREDGRTIVMVTHNEEQAKQTSRTIRFFDGRQVE